LPRTRLEFVINHHVLVHPMALVHYAVIEDAATSQRIDELTVGYADRTAYFVERLAPGLGRIAAVLHPAPVIVRMSDFKTNEYAHLFYIYFPSEDCVSMPCIGKNLNVSTQSESAVDLGRIPSCHRAIFQACHCAEARADAGPAFEPDPIDPISLAAPEVFDSIKLRHLNTSYRGESHD